jgi:hypothetical protein
MQNLQMPNTSKSLSLSELLPKFKSLGLFIFSKRVKIIFISLFASILGFFYAWFTPVKYISRLTFVVEESKSVGGGLSAIAGQFGFDLSGSGGGVFTGDNILFFLKSQNLCRETLLTFYDEEGKMTLADKYADVYGLKKKWSKSKKIGNINFSKYVENQMPRLEDSLLQVIINKHLLKNELNISRPDKKSSFIQVMVTTCDEQLSLLFAQRLVKNATSKYVESKTKLKAANVALLQKRADSLAALLNEKTYKAASSQQVLVDINPALKITPISAEISTREKTMISTIFAEVVKNLEITKSILNQETPTIQLVDESRFPLEKIKISKLKSILFWGIIAAIIYLIYLFLFFWVKVQLQGV